MLSHRGVYKHPRKGKVLKVEVNDSSGQVCAVHVLRGLLQSRWNKYMQCYGGAIWNLKRHSWHIWKDRWHSRNDTWLMIERYMAYGKWVYENQEWGTAHQRVVYVTSDRSSIYIKERFTYLQGWAYSTLGEVYDLSEVDIS